MKIKKIDGNFAIVSAANLTKRINIEMLADIKVGDYCIVHAGFAIQKIDSIAAEETLKIIYEIH